MIDHKDTIARSTGGPSNAQMGLQIKAARERTRQTQRELATKLGVNLTTLAKYEIGMHPVPPERVRQLASVLNAPELLAHTESDGESWKTESGGSASSGRDERSSVDIFALRDTLYEWWLEQAPILHRTEKLSPKRIEVLRKRLHNIVSDLLRGEGMRLDQMADEDLIVFLTASLRSLVQGLRAVDTSRDRTAA